MNNIKILLAIIFLLNTFSNVYSKGIDVSSWQGHIDWHKVKEAGVKFAFIKATEGTTYVDPDFKRNLEDATKYGIKAHAYHFFHPNEDPIAQAKHFISIAHHSTQVPALDVEQTNGVGKEDITENAEKWLSYVEKHFLKPVIYVSISFANSYLGDELNKWDLWVADWSPSPALPHQWKHYTYWQYTDKGHIDGINGNVDIDRKKSTSFLSQMIKKRDVQNELIEEEKKNKVIPFKYIQFKQCDPKWENQQIGTSSTTICHVGCLLTSLSMALHSHGYKISGNHVNPKTLNHWLTKHHGYAYGDNFIWGSLDSLPGINYIGSWSSLPYEDVKKALLNKKMVIANVHDGQHFVLVTGFDPADHHKFYVNDPYFETDSYTIGGFGIIKFFEFDISDHETMKLGLRI